MRKETSLVRPFFKMQQDTLQAYVSQAGIRFGPDGDFTIADSVKTDIKPDDTKLALYLPEQSELNVSPLTPADVRLVVVLRDDSRRKASVLLNAAVPDVVGEQVLPFQQYGVDFSGPKGGQLSLYIAVPEEREREVGLPWFAGHFIACKHFSINKSGPGKEFPVEFKSAQDLERLGYSGDTMVVVHGSPDDLHVEEIDDANIKILVNERLRGAIRTPKTSPRGKLVRGTLHYSGLAQLVELLKLAEDPDPLPLNSIGFLLRKNLSRASKGSKLEWTSIDANEIARMHSLAQSRAEILQLVEEVR